MKGAHPQVTCYLSTRYSGNSFLHLSGCLVSEGESKDLSGRNSFLKKMCYPVRKNPCFTRTCSGNNKRWSFRMDNSLLLSFIQVFEVITGHLFIQNYSVRSGTNLMDFIKLVEYYTNSVIESVNNRKIALPVRYWIVFVTVFLPLLLHGQLTAPGALSVRYTSYPSSPGIKDPVFVYCSLTGTEQGTLTATRPGGGGPFTFKWFRWNELPNSFSIAANTDSGVTSSTISNLTGGGYKVEIENSGIYDTSLVGWIVFDKPPYDGAQLKNPMKHCNYVALDGDTSATVKTFRYYDVVTGIQLNLRNKLTFIWSSDPSSTIPYPSIEIDPITFTPPLEDVTYSLKVNSLACSSEASFFYESIHVNADFTIDPAEGEAPLEVALTK